MKGRFFAGLLLAFVLVVGAIGLGTIAFNAGVSQGIAQGAQFAQGAVPEAGAAVRVYPAPYFYPRFFGFGFGLGGLLIVGLGFFLVFGLIRRLLWRGSMMGPSSMGHRFGPWAMNREGMEGIPPMVEEWHKRMHAKDPDKGQSTSNPQV